MKKLINRIFFRIENSGNFTGKTMHSIPKTTTNHSRSLAPPQNAGMWIPTNQRSGGRSFNQRFHQKPQGEKRKIFWQAQYRRIGVRHSGVRSVSSSWRHRPRRRICRMIGLWHRPSNASWLMRFVQSPDSSASHADQIFFPNGLWLFCISRPTKRRESTHTWNLSACSRSRIVNSAFWHWAPHREAILLWVFLSMSSLHFCLVFSPLRELIDWLIDWTALIIPFTFVLFFLHCGSRLIDWLNRSDYSLHFCLVFSPSWELIDWLLALLWLFPSLLSCFFSIVGVDCLIDWLTRSDYSFRLFSIGCPRRAEESADRAHGNSPGRLHWYCAVFA